MAKIPGSGSISKSHGFADPDLDPHQKVMNPQHCFQTTFDGGGGGIKSVIIGDCEQQGGNVLGLLSQLRLRIRPLVSVL